MDDRTKAKAAPTFAQITTRLQKIGGLGAGWGPIWDEKKCDKLTSFALPCDQSKRMFNLQQLPQLLEIVDIACTGRKDDTTLFASFLTAHRASTSAAPTLPN